MNLSAKPARALAFCALLTAGIAPNADALPLTFDLDTYANGNAGGEVVVTISEAATAGDVRIEVTNNTQGFVSDLFLNYGGGSTALAGATVNVQQTSGGDGVVAAPTVQFNGLQGFAIDFGFQTANNNPGRFGPGESITFVLDAPAALDAGLFDALGGKPFGDDYFAAVHLNSMVASGDCVPGTARLGDDNGANIPGTQGAGSCAPASAGGEVSPTSAVGVPEPHTLALAGLGVLGLVLMRRRRSR